jgi:hypothetical protein
MPRKYMILQLRIRYRGIGLFKQVLAQSWSTVPSFSEAYGITNPLEGRSYGEPEFVQLPQQHLHEPYASQIEDERSGHGGPEA